MPTLYSFVSRKSIAPTAEMVFNAETVSTVDEYKQVAQKAGEYAFDKDSKDAKLIQAAFSGLVSVHIWSEKTTTNAIVTRGEATDADGVILPFRTYGKKGEVVPETTITDKDKLSKLVWGVCFQNGKVVDEIKHLNGACKSFPVAYLRIA